MKKPPNIILFEPEIDIPEDHPPFLSVERNWSTLRYPNGESSERFVCDVVHRRMMDASVMIAHYELSGVRMLYLRSAVRPAIMKRFGTRGNLWELPAGLIEGEEDPSETASRETLEELGFNYPASEFKSLGTIFPAAGICAEQLYFFALEVDPEEKRKPTLDGGPMEKYGEVIQLSLDEAMRLVREGYFEDSKTELGLRRFADKYAKLA